MKFEKYSLNQYQDIINKYNDMEESLLSHCIYVMRRKNELTPEPLRKPYYIDENATFISEMNSDGVLVRVEEYWAYGGHETHYYHIMLDEIFNSSWEKKYKEKVAISVHTMQLEREKKN